MTEVKTVWVKAKFKESGRWVTKKELVRTERRFVEKGFFSKKQVEQDVPVYEEKMEWKVEGVSDKEVDGERFSKDIENAIISVMKEGYIVNSVIPVVSGDYKYDFKAPVINAGDRASYGWGYGFSFTEGVAIICIKA